MWSTPYTLRRNATRSPINVTTMRDVDDTNDHVLVEDLVDDSEFASSRGKPPLQLTPKRLADSVGILRKRTSNEFPASDSDRPG